MIQQIIFETKPDFIIEKGTGTGACALYYAAVLEGTQNVGSILTVDHTNLHAASQRSPLWRHHLQFLEGNATDAPIVKTIGDRVKGHHVLVVLAADSSANVLAALQSYAPIVTRGSYVIVEGAPLDGTHAPAGDNDAVDRFLAGGGSRDFERDRSREAVLWTSSPGGWLERK
jgi:cephalosporin hydroxylase